jgi:hypothetical protein
MKTSAKDQAIKFTAACKQHGFTWSIRGSVLVIKKAIPINDEEAFVYCDMVYWDILALAPLRGGSIWGTDGGSVGGYAALKSGNFVMNKSGEGKRFLTALAKLS